MLPRVLLHVIEPSIPINGAVHRITPKLAIQYVPDRAILGEDVKHLYSVSCCRCHHPKVIWLTTTGRIKGCPIQKNRWLAIHHLARQYLRVKLPQISIPIVQSLCFQPVPLWKRVLAQGPVCLPSSCQRAVV